jgi:hypothetical protein
MARADGRSCSERTAAKALVSEIALDRRFLTAEWVLGGDRNGGAFDQKP